MKTFDQDHTLPALPVPELQATCAAIPELVAPLVDASTLAATLAALEDFSRPGGTGEVLQSALEERRDGMPGNASWLRPFWDDMYLAWRGPLPLTMNYCFRFAERRWGGEAALPRLVRALGEVLLRLHKEELEPERTKAGYLSMDQISTCLYTRIPGRNRDSLLMVEAHGPRSIAVTCRGHWFLVPLLPGDGRVAGEKALHETFAAIRKEALDLPPGPSVAAMTSASREEAASLRADLNAFLQNRLNLAALEQCLFVVCLDPPHQSPDDLLLKLLGGEARSRWFDKSLQIIATENQGLGANFEHAGCDAAIWLYLLEQTDSALLAEHPDQGREERPGNTVPGQSCAVAAQEPGRERVPHTLLRWEVPGGLKERLEMSCHAFSQRVGDLDLACREYPAFSREALKALGTSPDAFLQTAFQAAQHEVFGKMRSSYEAISMRCFAQGRTECARGGSGDALALALALRKGSPPEKLLDLYRQAERTHKARVTRCQRGLAVERHMTGLQAMHTLYGEALGLEETPALFSDPGWKTLKHDALSTSGIGAPFIRFFGFGPVVEDGFGIGYAPGQDSTGLVVTAGKTPGSRAEAFADAFTRAAESLAALLRQSGPAD